MLNIMQKNESYIFVEMTIQHYEKAINLWETSEAVKVTIGDSKSSVDKYLQRNPGMSFVSIDKASGKIVGTVLAGHDGRRGYIYHLNVHPDHRNRNIGKTLIDLSMSALKSEGIKRCIIMVKANNEPAKDFWNRVGWDTRVDLNMYSINLNSEEM